MKKKEWHRGSKEGKADTMPGQEDFSPLGTRVYIGSDRRKFVDTRPDLFDTGDHQQRGDPAAPPARHYREGRHVPAPGPAPQLHVLGVLPLHPAHHFVALPTKGEELVRSRGGRSEARPKKWEKGCQMLSNLLRSGIFDQEYSFRNLLEYHAP